MTVNGVKLINSVECSNPAFGLRRLDEWETDVMAKVERKSRKAV